MRKSYSPPALIDYGSIAQTTFATPAVRKKYPSVVFPAPQQTGTQYFCVQGVAGVYAGEGGKNYIELQCDKFGEYSHS